MSVYVEPAIVTFPYTYISSKTLFTIRLHNKHSQKVHYEWRRESTDENELDILDKTDIGSPEARSQLESLLAYHSKYFQIETLSGELWPHRFEQVVVSFTPELSDTYTDTAYLYIRETDERIPVGLRGTGLAPEAAFNMQAISIGHVALESILEYEVILRNTGQTEVDFNYEKKETPGLIFEFSPESGKIAVNNSITVHIRFIANSVCSFNETFKYQIKGSTGRNPTINFYGKVLGPTFVISKRRIDFETVSFGFLYSQSFEIENKSEIPFDFNFRLSQDGSFSRREFSLRPSAGTIGKYAKQSVTLEFIPVSIQVYNIQLYFDIAKFGEQLAVIPITATCICPPVNILKNNIDLGNVFFNFHYDAALQIIDDSDYPAKFEFVPATDTTQLQAKTTVANPSGIIMPHTKTKFKVTIHPQQLGPLSLTHYIRIYGSDSPPIPFTINAICVGPNIIVSHKEILYGQIRVLQDIRQSINLTNDSLIPAIFTCKMEDEAEVYQVSPSEGTIPPGGSQEVTVIAHLDDTVTFLAHLVFNFHQLNPISILVKGTGIGTPIVPSINMNRIDLGYIFSERPVIHEFSFDNKGRRPQELRWSFQKPKVEGNGEPDFKFQVVPDVLVIQPHEVGDFKFIFQCNKPASFTIVAQCHATFSKKRIELFTPHIKGTFIRPLLQFSQQTLEFKHLHDIEQEELISTSDPNNPNKAPSQDLLHPMENYLVITNLSQLPLDMKIDCPSPFSISSNNVHLETQNCESLVVTFDPSFKTDFISETINKKITFNFTGHPQQLFVNLKGLIVFPNITFSPTKSINFGNLLMNTEQNKDITITNDTELPVDLVWELLMEGNNEDPTKIFDIYPIRAHIEPFKQDIVRFAFFALGQTGGRSAKYSGTAVCHVIGGPEYVIDLKGGSAAIQYKIDPLQIDFGCHDYHDRLREQITLQNLSDVPISFTVKIPKACKFNVFNIHPMDGTVAIGETITLELMITGGLPKVYAESFFIQIGHFDDVRVDIELECVSPLLQIHLPRHEEDPAMIAFNQTQIAKLSRPKSVRRAQSSEDDDDDMSIHFDIPTPEELCELEKQQLVQRLTSHSLSSTFNRRRRDNIFTGPVAARYILDMGKIVFGETYTKTFKLVSKTSYPISFEIKTENLVGTGFNLEPTYFKDVPPDEEVEITVNFNTANRSNELLDEVEYEILVCLCEDITTIINLQAFLAMPVLNFSQLHFDFRNVIVGQSYVYTLQLQNMNNVQCEFKFGDAQYMNVLQRNAASNSPAIFIANPSNGILPPASFQNIDIIFSPLSERSYSMQFPIEIKHNTQMSFVTLKGYGVQLKIQFDPPELILPPINPFCEPSTATVRLINPTQYPIEVLSTQFDLQLLVDQLKQEQTAAAGDGANADQLPVQFSEVMSNNKLAKFSICILVHGAPGSGRTTVSKAISASMDNVPIISLKEIWKDLLAKEDVTQADFVTAFSDLINQREYKDGFIVDGLDGLPEPSETDTFLNHCAKQKSQDLSRNPTLVFPHTTLTACEQALAYILAALDGHYVFHIALKADEPILLARDEILKTQEKKRKRLEQHNEKKELFSMTETDYLNYEEAKRVEVDKKRQNFRKRLLKSALEEDEKAAEGKTSSRRHHKSGSSAREHSSGDRSARRKKSSHDRSERPSGESKRSSAPKEDGAEDSAPKRRRGGVPTDPIPKSVYLFNFTLGTIVQRLKEGGESFQVVDPVELIGDTSATPRSQVSQMREEEEDVGSSRAATPFPGEKSKKAVEPPPPITIQSDNTLIVNVVGTVDEINQYVIKYLPKLNQLKEKAFTRLIPAPKMLTHSSHYNPPKLMNPPKYFSFVTEPVDPEILTLPEPVAPSGKKGGRQSRQKKSKGPTALILDSSIDINKRTTRWQIEAKSDVTLTVRFEAKLIGKYHDSLFFNILNAKADTAKFIVRGNCNYPDIERSIVSIFPRRVKKLDAKVKKMYVNDLNEYHFGSLLVVKERTGKNTPAMYRDNLVITNISEYPTEVNAFLHDSSPKPVFTLETTNFTLQPNDKMQLFFGVHPVIPGIYRSVINLYVKDHPDPLEFNFVAEACQPIIEINTTTLDFDKLLLNQNKTLTLELKNTGKLPAYWRFQKTQVLGASFTFNAVEGLINPRQTFNVTCLYKSNKPFSIKKPIQLEILDENKARIFSTQTLQVMAESFDVNFDFTYPKGIDHLQFDSLKVGQPKVIACQLKNRGKYPTVFKIVITSQKVQKLFQITPMEGTLQPSDKTPLQVTFRFCSNRLCKFNNTKGISLRITDSMTNATTAEIPLPFSAVTLYSAFSIDPMKGLEFGSAPVNVPVTRQFKITNNGVFPFEYDISAKPEPEVAKPKTAADNKRKKTPQRPATATKGRPRKGNEKTVVVGNFLVINSVATVQPNQSATIDIEFMSSFPGDSNSTAIIKITDVNPAEVTGGIEFKLGGSAFVPGIISREFENIFPGTHLCLRFDLSRLDTTAFLEDDQILHFMPIVLQQRSSVVVKLINPQPIPIQVDANIVPNTKGAKGKSTFPFDITERTFQIAPNQTSQFSLSFTPTICEKFQGTFEAIVKNGTNPETKNLKFGVEGVGTLPTIAVITQLDNKNVKNSMYNINLGKTLVGFTKDKVIALKNDGLIPTRIQITAKATPDFMLQELDTTEVISLDPEQIFNIPVVFAPEKVRKSQFDIQISVLDNPKANVGFVFVGEGFSEDIMFEGLTDEDNGLVFKDNVVGRQSEMSFIMRNVSQNDIRFTWQNHNDFTFNPKVGHLRLGKSKEIKVTFFSDKPVKHNGIKINCQWNKIEILDKDAPDWDDSMKFIKFVTRGSLAPEPPKVDDTKKPVSSRKNSIERRKSVKSLPPPPAHNPDDDEIVRITEIKPEPNYQVIAGKYKDLQMKIFAISDYIKYQIDTTEIEFAPTMMYQNRTIEAKVTNSCQIRFEYSWIIRNFTCLRSDYAKEHKPPFSVQPRTGFIESGQSTIFKINFTPEEVDDFKAILQCEIPFLSQMKPPSIDVTGFSRRPLCHFNVATSDYITGGRRHPDYNYQLPDDVKVIEIFCKSVGFRTTKKFEIINPTSSPYEIQCNSLIDSSNGAIQCDTPAALISSGKRYLASFTYYASSVKTVEALFEFLIQEHQIRVPVLIVGRIMPS